MARVNYLKSIPLQDFAYWAERELEQIERAIDSIPTTAQSNEESNTVYYTDTGDENKVKVSTASTDTAFVIQPSSTTAFEVGTWIHFYQAGTGTLRLIAGSGVTLVSRKGLQSAGQHAMFRIWQRSADYWVASGDLVASTSNVILPGVATLTITGLAPTVS